VFFRVAKQNKPPGQGLVIPFPPMIDNNNNDTDEEDVVRLPVLYI